MAFVVLCKFWLLCCDMDQVTNVTQLVRKCVNFGLCRLCAWCCDFCFSALVIFSFKWSLKLKRPMVTTWKRTVDVVCLNTWGNGSIQRWPLPECTEKHAIVSEQSVLSDLLKTALCKLDRTKYKKWLLRHNVYVTGFVVCANCLTLCSSLVFDNRVAGVWLWVCVRVGGSSCLHNHACITL